MEPEMPETTALRDAVEGLYEAFARYPLRKVVNGCPHCIDSSDNDMLHARPLRELSWRELSRFGWKTMTTWGTVDDYRHFLPRMLELVAIELDPALAPPDGPTGALYGWPYNYEPLFGKLEYGKWRTWPREERQAIQTYLIALWRRLLATYPQSSIFAETLLDCYASIGEDLTPYLDVWRADRRLAAMRHLAQFVTGGVWTVGEAYLGPVERWLWEPQTRAALEDAFFAQADNPPLAEEFSRAVDQLTSYSPAK
jgi:hypothetical protein